MITPANECPHARECPPARECPSRKLPTGRPQAPKAALGEASPDVCQQASRHMRRAYGLSNSPHDSDEEETSDEGSFYEEDVEYLTTPIFDKNAPLPTSVPMRCPLHSSHRAWQDKWFSQKNLQAFKDNDLHCKSKSFASFDPLVAHAQSHNDLAHKEVVEFLRRRSQNVQPSPPPTRTPESTQENPAHLLA